MSEEGQEARDNDEFAQRVEERIASMRKAGQRLKEDMARAERNDRPRRYADSAINDAEYAIEGHLEGAREGIRRMDGGEDSTQRLSGRVTAASDDCAEIVTGARDDAEDRWPVPMD